MRFQSQKNNEHPGFTLIELVVVIVVLGILSAVILPKFIDLNSEAKASVIESLSDNLASAVELA